MKNVKHDGADDVVNMEIDASVIVHSDSQVSVTSLLSCFESLEFQVYKQIPSFFC